MKARTLQRELRTTHCVCPAWVAGLPVLLTVVFAAGAWAAGGTTHCEMGQRAWDQYLVPERDMLPGLADLRADDDAMRAFYCGCVFPDFGYDGINADAAEYAHWYPFHNAYFEYIKERFPPPWDSEARRHVAFFLGVICHGVGDTPWHFDEGGDKSFITAAREHDANEDADVVAEIFGLVLFRLRPRLAGCYWWACDDALAVFQRCGVAVTRDEIERGCRTQEAEWKKGAMFGPIAYPVFESRYPWTRKHFEDYYYGGVQHGAALTAMCIRQYYARWQGWHVYQNTPLRKVVFPGERPYLPCVNATVSPRQPENGNGGGPFWRSAEERTMSSVRSFGSTSRILHRRTCTRQSCGCPSPGGAAHPRLRTPSSTRTEFTRPDSRRRLTKTAT